jgi:hypothetical protein
MLPPAGEAALLLLLAAACLGPGAQGKGAVVPEEKVGFYL